MRESIAARCLTTEAERSRVLVRKEACIDYDGIGSSKLWAAKILEFSEVASPAIALFTIASK